MKRFLLLCVLFVACLAPCAEGDIINVDVAAVAGLDLEQKMKSAIAANLPTSATGNSITIDVNANVPIAAVIPVPYTYLNAADPANPYTFETVTITGSGSNTLTAAASRHFSVNATGQLEFNDAADIILDGKSTNGGLTVNAGTVKFNKSTVSFTNNRNAQGGGAINVKTGATVDFGTATLTFSDNESTGANGGGAIYSENALTIPGGTFTNNKATFATGTGANGGAIASTGDVTLTAKAQFTGNNATQYGGAIYSEGTVTVADGTFGGSGTDINKAKMGGAIYADSVKLTGTKVDFTNNQATDGNGGAIYSANTVEVASGIFTDNTAKITTATTANGGAIYSAKDVTLTSTTTFKGNKAENGNGGAIYSDGTVTVADGTFGGTGTDINIAKTSGGAIYAKTSVELTGKTEFTGNTAEDGDGGAICSKGDVKMTAAADFKGNTAESGKGGAIYSDGTVTVAGGAFGGTGPNDPNIAQEGGAIHAAEVELTGKTDFTNNQANTTTGGAIHSVGAVTLGIAAHTFTGNEAATNGGAIFTEATALMTVNGQTFKDNKAKATASNGGGAIYTAGPVEVTNGTFSGNIAGNDDGAGNVTQGNGGAIFTTDDVTIANGTFDKNMATDGMGGAIYTKTGTVTVNGGSFGVKTANTAAEGGAIYAKEAQIKGGTFKDNTGTGTGGGAVYADTVILTGTPQFESNTAPNGDGGAVYVANATGTMSIEGGNFSWNTAFRKGGAIYSEKEVEVTNGAFSGNETTGSPAVNGCGGGAIYGAKKVTVKGGSFSDNQNKNNGGNQSGGGAIYAVGDVTVEGGGFYGNKSLSSQSNSGGGAIWSGGTVTVTGGDFSSLSTNHGTAAGSGGAIYAVTKISISLKNSTDTITFSYHDADKDGGALFSENTIEATNAIFLYNTTGNLYNGGATLSMDGSTFTNCYFYRNSAGYDGGASRAIYFAATNCTYSHNSAGNGGGAIVATGDGSISKCAFDSNTATKDGGAIFVTGGLAPLAVDISYFTGNSSGQGGGGAIATSGTPSLTLWRCTFNDNHADGGGNGGAAYIDASTFKIANCTFYGNEAKGGGDGGALHLVAGAGGYNSALVFNTIVNNTAAKGGGVSSTADFDIGANIIVENNASPGDDIYASGANKMRSHGYNFIGVYGELSTSGPHNLSWAHGSCVVIVTPDPRGGAEDSSTYKIPLFFSGGLDYNGNKDDPIGASAPIGTTVAGFVDYKLTTLALRPSDTSSSNPAQEFIPESSASRLLKKVHTGDVDERGELRTDPTVVETDPKWDAGAYDTCERNRGGVVPPSGDDTIKYIQISGLPNTLRTVGQTTSLFAVGYNIHNKIVNRDVRVKWTTDNTGVADFPDAESGNIFVYSLGTTTITATPIDLYDVPAATAKLRVTEGESFTNVHNRIWQTLGIYNDELSAYGAGLTIATAEDPALVRASTFQSSFKKIWSLSAQVAVLSSASDANNVHFTSRTAVGALKPGVNVAVTGREKGELLPFEYTWTFSYKALSDLLERDVTAPPSAEELAKFVQIDFEAFSGAKIPVIVSSSTSSKAAYLSSASGVNAGDAALTKALEVKESHDGATIHLKAYLANVQGTDGAQLVERLLVVPDGVADNAISGTMWLNKKVESSNSNNNNNNNNDSNKGNGGGGGGGGGCDATGLGLAVLLLALPLLARRRR